MIGRLNTAVMVGALGVVAMAATPRPAQANWPVFDAAVAAQQAKADAMQALQWAQQVKTAAIQLQEYQNLVVQGTRLSSMQWSNVTGDVLTLRNIENQASLLSGNSGAMLSSLNSSGAYAGRLQNLPFMLNQYSSYQQSSGNALQTMGDAINVQNMQQANDAAILTGLDAQSSSAVGEMQALSAANEFASQEDTELLQINSTLTTESQMLGAAQAEQADRDATDDQWVRNFVSVNQSPLAVAGPAY